jgi:uncharacterized protein (DUF305 family)
MSDTDGDADAHAGALEERDAVSDDDGGELDPLPGVSVGRVVALVLAFAWLAGAFGWFLGQRDSDPGARSVEVGFYQDMISHHEQAVAMSLIELQRGTDPTIRSFAQEIVIFQQYEIGLMDQRLADWGFGRSDRADKAMAWMGMPPVDVAEMPGMASDADLDELRAAEGATADAKFLELMSEHHRGGVHMASFAYLEASDAGVRRLAARMQRNQAVEVNEFAQTAERLGFDIEIERMEVPDL